MSWNPIRVTKIRPGVYGAECKLCGFWVRKEADPFQLITKGEYLLRREAIEQVQTHINYHHPDEEEQ